MRNVLVLLLPGTCGHTYWRICIYSQVEITLLRHQNQLLREQLDARIYSAQFSSSLPAHATMAQQGLPASAKVVVPGSHEPPKPKSRPPSAIAAPKPEVPFQRVVATQQSISERIISEAGLIPLLVICYDRPEYLRCVYCVVRMST